MAYRQCSLALWVSADLEGQVEQPGRCVQARDICVTMRVKKCGSRMAFESSVEEMYVRWRFGIKEENLEHVMPFCTQVRLHTMGKESAANSAR